MQAPVLSKILLQKLNERRLDDAFKNAIKKAELYAGTGVIEDIAAKII